MTNLIQRALTGTVLLLLIFISIIWSPYGFIVLLFAINILALFEFYRLFQAYTFSPRNLAGTILSLSILVTFSLVITNINDWRILLINIIPAFCIFILEL